jgi:hypothetical protein
MATLRRCQIMDAAWERAFEASLRVLSILASTAYVRLARQFVFPNDWQIKIRAQRKNKLR